MKNSFLMNVCIKVVILYKYVPMYVFVFVLLNIFKGSVCAVYGK